MPEKIITGDWDGIPIWRYKTAEELLLEELEKNLISNSKQP